MKHLMIFNIDNSQYDYSCVMECISLLKNSKLDEVGKLIKECLNNKFYRMELNTETVTPRYFECPKGEFIRSAVDLNLIDNKNISRYYYNALKRNDIKNFDKEVYDKLSNIYFKENNTLFKAVIPGTLYAKIFHHVNTSRSQMKDSISMNEIYYHIRINVSNNTICNLQYLALLLKKFNSLVKDRRISVLLISDEITLKYYPFCDPNDEKEQQKINESHKFFSRYLRLLAQDNTGVIYAPYYERIKGKDYIPNVLPMNYKDTSIGSNFFPIMEIGANEYIKLFGESKHLNEKETVVRTLSSEIKEEDLYQRNSATNNKHALFQIGSWRFYNADAKNPHEALLAFIAETAWKRLRINWLDDQGKLDKDKFAVPMEKIINKFTKEKNNWISFAIFAFLLSGTDKRNPLGIRINESYKMARELSIGLQQLIQNAIQHSESHSCFFTFFLDEHKGNLKIFVVDVNTENTMIQNFKKRLEDEISVCRTMNREQSAEDIEINYNMLISGHNNLIKSDDIALRHFFNKFNNYSNQDEITLQKENYMLDIWSKFRQSDTTAHIGLLIFYQTLIHCHADLRLQSSKFYSINNQDNIFIDLAEQREDYELNTLNINKSDKLDIDDNLSRIIPGTQYCITVPINNWHISNPVGKASISNIDNFSEDYKAFAKFVDYEPKKFDEHQKFKHILKQAHNYGVVNPENKYKLQLLWTKFWINCFSNLNRQKNTNKVYVWRITDDENIYLSDIDNIEVFLKGMFGALNSEFKIEYPMYFAIINLNSVFLECLRNICISLSNRQFPKELQLFFVDNMYEKYAQIYGTSLYEAVINALQLSIEHGSTLFNYNDTVSVNHIAKLNNYTKSQEPIAVMPFDIIITVTEEDKKTIFDAHMHNLIEQRLDKAGSQGYKLKNTHMRLGNKVHIQSFYEVSFLFYRTTISNRIAYKILRSYSVKLLEKINKEDYCVEPILYYSYASYSKAILTSLVEMTREYLKQYIISDNERKKEIGNCLNEKILEEKIQKARAQIAFASYQHNVQSETNSDSIQLYFSIPKEYKGAKLKNDGNNGEMSLSLNCDIAVVQVVPISSTLTTFDKMFGKLKKRILKDLENNNELILSANYTALWVCDQTNIKKRIKDTKLFPSNIEKTYWESADLAEHRIHIRTDNDNLSNGLFELKDCPYVNYFIKENAFWEHPIICSLCFPDENELIREVPLVETDLTSTVPSQQIREEKSMKSFVKSNLETMNSDIKSNNDRLRLLRDCVYYGHIKRSKNHHQYYISTQDFFYKNEVQTEIRKWLTHLRNINKNQRPKLKIIFSPEHNTNVGFAQYVNTYYFGGTAEVISINEDKVFRSNFICEHETLRQSIERIHMQSDVFNKDEPVEFYFVDDSINTGATIHKANSLLRSLLPEEYISMYPAFIFKKCFILIDRISNASKKPYVMSGNISDFHSFVHIDISNMRVYGDSCVGCKLQKNAKKLFKRSATRITANYWANKYKRLKPISYDDINEMETRKIKIYAYERMILSHIAQNYIFKDGVLTSKKGEYYDCILFLFYAIFEYKKDKDKAYNNMLKNKNFHFKDLLSEIIDSKAYGDENNKKKSLEKSKLCIAELLLKLLSRPFFSFDHSLRVQMQSFLLILAECYLRNYSDDDKIIYADQNLDVSKWNTNVDLLYNMIPMDDKHKAFLLHNNRLEKTIEIAKAFLKLHNDNPLYLSNFFKNVLFEALADMRSTYLLRKSVILRINKFVKKYLSDSKLNNDMQNVCKCGINECEYLLDSSQCSKNSANCFWISYITHIQRILDCSSDEIKSVWFEYLIILGNEIKGYNIDDIKIDIPDCIPGIQEYIPLDDFPVVAELFLTTSTTEFDTTKKLIENTGDKTYILNNYNMTRKWLNRKTEVNDKIKNWYELLPSVENQLVTDNNDVPKISERYKQFLDYLVTFISELNQIDENVFNIALLTMSKSEKSAAIDKIQLVVDRFCKNTIAHQDKKQARYIIKDRVTSAFNGDVVNDNSIGILTENGYHMVFASPVSNEDYKLQQENINYDDSHHVSDNYRKPYIILFFDNPNKSIQLDDLGRKLVPLSRVFLYISMNIEEESMRNKLPWFILRDILAYRNRIMRFLSENFNGDIMEKHAVSLQEEAILTHERSASHASTSDDKGVLKVFGIENVSELNFLTYPIDIESKQIVTETKKSVNYLYSADLWLLLQNYVNGQIARLFTRQFNSNDKDLIERDGIPALYLSRNDEQEEDIFKRCLITFSDLNITPSVQNQDNRFKLMGRAANIYYHNIDNAKLYYSVSKDNKTRKYYNAEYIRCILLDIIFSSLKYSTVNDSLLPRVDSLIYYKEINKKRKYSSVECNIIIFKDSNNLVILNNVKENRMCEDMINSVNEEIYRRTHDSLDYGDGHMSLFTIRNFVLGIRKEDSHYKNDKIPDTLFKYLKKEDILKQYKHLINYEKIINKYDIWFETCLPIFMEEDCDGKK